MTAQEFLDESIASIKLKHPEAQGVTSFYFTKGETGKPKINRISLHFANLIQCLKDLESIELKSDFLCWISQNDNRYNALQEPIVTETVTEPGLLKEFLESKEN